MKTVVAHIRATNFFGGPERQIVGHIQSSNSYSHLVVTFTRTGERNEFAEICRSHGIKVADIVSKSNYQLTVYQQLKQVLIENNVKVICTHGYKPLLLCLLLRFKTKIPVIAFARGHTTENWKVKLYSFLERKGFRYADKVVSVSGGYKEYLVSVGIKDDSISVVRNAVDFSRFPAIVPARDSARQRFGISENEFVIATAGRLSPEKNQQALIEAFKDIVAQNPECSLYIVGDGPMRSTLEQIVKRLDIHNVRFLGHRNDLDELMPLFDLFVLPSLSEGLPNVLLEAAYCGVPIIATRVGGVPEVIEDTITGLLVAPGAPKELTYAISNVLLDKNATIERSRAAREHIANNFDFQSQRLQLESLYDLLSTP